MRQSKMNARFTSGNAINFEILGQVDKNTKISKIST